MTFLTELERLKSAATKGEWSVPHLCRDDIDCNCASILVEGYMGGIGEIWADNGKRISEGGNDCPPLHEAKANGALIAFLVNHADALAELVRAADRINNRRDDCFEHDADFIALHDALAKLNGAEK